MSGEHGVEHVGNGVRVRRFTVASGLIDVTEEERDGKFRYEVTVMMEGNGKLDDATAAFAVNTLVKLMELSSLWCVKTNKTLEQRPPVDTIN